MSYETRRCIEATDPWTFEAVDAVDVEEDFFATTPNIELTKVAIARFLSKSLFELDEGAWKRLSNYTKTELSVIASGAIPVPPVAAGVLPVPGRGRGRGRGARGIGRG